MNKSLKIGIISGLIAGFVLAIVNEIFINIRILLGLYTPFVGSLITNNLVMNIPLFGFWGIVLGIIYSKVYNVLPRKGILKGLVYGLILYILVTIRIEFFSFAYGKYLDAFGHIFAGFFQWMAYGLVLGFLYEFLSSRFYSLEKEVKIETYDVKSGILPGAIAGFLGGFVVSIFIVIGHVTGYWGITTAGEIISTIDFWVSQMGSHVFINMFWGSIFGAIFARVYNLVPYEKIKKGLIYGLVIFLITSFQVETWIICWGASRNLWTLVINEIIITFLALIMFSTFGIVLGLLYKPKK